MKTFTIDRAIARLGPAAQLDAVTCIHAGLMATMEEILTEDEKPVGELLLEALAGDGR